MTTEPPPLKRLTPLDMQDNFSITMSLRYQLAGDPATFREAPCGDGHRSRCGLHCPWCLDAEMMRRGFDVSKEHHRFGLWYEVKFKRNADGSLSNVLPDDVPAGMVRKSYEMPRDRVVRKAIQR